MKFELFVLGCLLLTGICSAKDPEQGTEDTTSCNNGRGVFENMIFGITSKLDRIEYLIAQQQFRMSADDDPSDHRADNKGIPSEMACYESGYREEGHEVMVFNRKVFCDPTYGGWLVFLRRQDGSVNFTRSWDEYKHGFGDIHGEFWLGNELIHQITSRWHYKLRVDLVDLHNETGYAEYQLFRVRQEETYQYQVIVEGYVESSNGGDAMAYHNRALFSTYDVDNDKFYGNCAEEHRGGWWYRTCSEANPTGLYTTDPTYRGWDGIRWYFAHLDDRSFQKIEMKIRPIY